MYNIYSTEGFILKSAAKSEADKFFAILTREFGLIMADGRGVRKLDSKLRYALQDFSLVDLSLVRGKEKWRITNAVLVKNVSANLRGSEVARAILARAASLIFRLVHGEEKNEALYEYCKNAALFFADKRPAGLILQNTEYLLMLRILYALGYLGNAPDWSAFTASPIFETELILRMEESKRRAIATINRSLKESHL